MRIYKSEWMGDATVDAVDEGFCQRTKCVIGEEKLIWKTEDATMTLKIT